MTVVRVGGAEIRRVEELSLRLPFAMFGAEPALVATEADWLRPRWIDADDTWEMVVQSWIVIVDDRVVLVDPCVGNGRELPAFPLFDRLETPYIERFAATGLRPGDVDIVVCTHLHSDHCGWNTVLRDGRWVPTFPKARYLLPEREIARWDPRLPGHQPIPENDGVFERSVLPVLEAGLADRIGDHHTISASLSAELASGHTLGHTVLRLRSEGSEAWFTGDAFHHPIELIEPALDEHSCEDFALAIATRRRLIEHFIASGALIVPAHFAAPHMGHLREEAGRRRFVPLSASS